MAELGGSYRSTCGSKGIENPNARVASSHPEISKRMLSGLLPKTLAMGMMIRTADLAYFVWRVKHPGV